MVKISPRIKLSPDLKVSRSKDHTAWLPAGAELWNISTLQCDLLQFLSKEILTVHIYFIDLWPVSNIYVYVLDFRCETGKCLCNNYVFVQNGLQYL